MRIGDDDPEDFPGQTFHDLHFRFDSPYDRNFKVCRRTTFTARARAARPATFPGDTATYFGTISRVRSCLVQYDAQLLPGRFRQLGILQEKIGEAT